MILTRLLAGVLKQTPEQGDAPEIPARFGVPSVLNVGGGSKAIPIPSHYNEWNHVLLDVSNRGNVDVVLDARLLETSDQKYDAIYCSHNLEHYFRHDCATVLRGFRHVLKSDGFAEIRVPDVASVFNAVQTRDLDIDDVLYTSGGGPITVHDVIYGWRKEIERSGEDFYAHKRGFTEKTLSADLVNAGFEAVWVARDEELFELRAMAFMSTPNESLRQHFDLGQWTSQINRSMTASAG